jgi:N-methylhydantoinase A
VVAAAAKIVHNRNIVAAAMNANGESSMAVRIGIDTGGTFTDLIGLDEATGGLVFGKTSSTPDNPVRAITDALDASGVEHEAIEFLVVGTTVATNALLQRKGADVIFLTTAGFEDVPFIQRMNRRHHYSLEWTKPKPLVKRRDTIGVPERLGYRGEILTPLDEAALETVANAVAGLLSGRDESRAAIAICLLFSYINPEHELRLGAFLRKRFPDVPISLSHEVAPIWREYERGSTVIADAYVKPTIGTYIDNIRRRFETMSLHAPWALMKSNGGNAVPVSAEAQPIQLLLSGLSGGVIGGAFYGKQAGEHELITLDMGGTSCDVGIVRNGQIGYSTNFEIEWGLPVAAPSVDLTTIGAGGGSIAWVDKGGFLRLGPQSAGAEPGPACYGKGGRDATVTDANLVLGRLNSEYFLGGKVALDPGAAERAVSAIAQQLNMEILQAAQAIIDVTNENMANAIRVLSIDRGLDARDFALVAFGGAGPLHAGALARKMHMTRVVLPLYPGLCSAFGALIADLQVNKVHSKNFRSSTVDAATVREDFARLVDEAVAELRQEGFTGTPEILCTISMRYAGQNYEQDIPVDAEMASDAMLRQILAAFERRHEEFYGYSISGEVIELIRFNVTALGRTPKPNLPRLDGRGPAAPVGERSVYFSESGQLETTIYRRELLPAGARLAGPAIIEEAGSTTLLHPASHLTVDDHGLLLMTV